MSRRSGQSGSIQKDGKWYVVRYWKDVEGQEKRQRVRAKICPISGPGKLSVSERERKAKEIIAASGVDTQEYFDKVVLQSKETCVTFHEQAATWLESMRNRKRKPVAPSTLATWAYALENWINVNIGDLPLQSINNAALKNLVNKMNEGGLSPKSISNYAQIVKVVMKSVRDEKGQRLFNVQWDHEYIDMPVVKNQRQPSFTGEVVTGILRQTEEEKYRVLFALCASAGLRFGEALGINMKNVSPDCSTVKIVEKAWGSAVQDFLKTANGEREVDLHPLMATMLREYISRRASAKHDAERKSGLLFCSRNGKPLHQSSTLRRKLHPVLAKLRQPKCGVHAFRRFRNTYLRNFTTTPPGLIKFWMGHAGEGMSDLYDKIKEDVAFRKEVAEKAGLGFELPSKIPVVGPNGPKWTETPDAQLVASV
jgi:integrase